MHRYLRYILIGFASLSFIVSSLAAPLNLTEVLNKKIELSSDLPRYQKLPLFNPYRKSFECVYQAQHVPPIDPESEKWFLQAMALMNSQDIEYLPGVDNTQKIFDLLKKSAERKNWKALHHLATFVSVKYVELDLPEDAWVRILEEGMKLGIPDAYNQMGVFGVFHPAGRSVEAGDSLRNYAFLQKAADMGNPSAQAYLGFKMSTTYEIGDEFWANEAIGIKMMQCAFAQDNGEAAYNLGGRFEAKHTKEGNKLALMYYHQGVKLGNADCAKALFVIFKDGSLVAPLGVDKPRAKRYFEISQMLRWYLVQLPNLDKVLPLPPAKLPVWDGDEDHLFDAAKAVLPINKTKAKLTRGSKPHGRAHIPQG